MKTTNLLFTLALVIIFNSAWALSPENDRVLIVIPTNNVLENGNESTSFNLSTLIESYSALKKANFIVDIATINGGEAKLSQNSLDEVNHYGAVKSLYKSIRLSEKLENTLAINAVNALDYKALICLGNMPSIKEFSNNKTLHKLIRKVYENNGVIATMDNAVSALINVKLSNNDFLIKDRKIASSTTQELISLFQFKDREEILEEIPFIPEEIIKANGGNFEQPKQFFSSNVVEDNRIITAGLEMTSKTGFINTILKTISKPMKKVLIVVTSNDKLLDGSPAGFYLPEVTDFHYILSNGGDFEFDIASPKGGKAPMYDELGFLYDQAYQKYLLDTGLLVKLYNTIPLSEIKPEDYVAVHFAGGFASLTDFPSDENLKKITRDIYEQDGIVSAVCHGPSALLNVKLSNGKYLLDGLKVTSRTVEEETANGAYSKEQILQMFPIMLEDEIREQKAIFTKGGSLEGYIESDKRVVTGQGVPSTTPLAKEVLEQLHNAPKK